MAFNSANRSSGTRELTSTMFFITFIGLPVFSWGFRFCVHWRESEFEEGRNQSDHLIVLKRPSEHSRVNRIDWRHFRNQLISHVTTRRVILAERTVHRICGKDNLYSTVCRNKIRGNCFGERITYQQRTLSRIK